MAETTSEAVHNATQDSDLRHRLISAAALEGVDDPATWVAEHIYPLAVAPIEGTDTIAGKFQYAVDTRPPPPGRNRGAVTDAHLRTAVKAVRAQAQPTGGV